MRIAATQRIPGSPEGDETPPLDAGTVAHGELTSSLKLVFAGRAIFLKRWGTVPN